MARILLDSTVLIDALRGRPAAERVRHMRRAGDEPWVCVISIEENYPMPGLRLEHWPVGG
jgi:predicted nucleic acid-binding protein